MVDNFGAKSTITKEVKVSKTQSTLLAEEIIGNQNGESTSDFEKYAVEYEGSEFNIILFAVLIVILIAVAVIVIRHTDLI